jgi:hypothetical protein
MIEPSFEQQRRRIDRAYFRMLAARAAHGDIDPHLRALGGEVAERRTEEVGDGDQR